MDVTVDQDSYASKISKEATSSDIAILIQNECIEDGAINLMKASCIIQTYVNLRSVA